jgi:hypothetical protein
MENYINSRLYHYLAKNFIDNIIKYKIYEICKLEDSPAHLSKYNIFSFDIVRGDYDLCFHNNQENEYIPRFLLDGDSSNYLHNINCYNLLLCSTVFYEKETK